MTHDHIDLTLESGTVLRFNDPRRFGCWLWTEIQDCFDLGAVRARPAVEGEGAPTVVSAPDSAAGTALEAVAQKVAGSVGMPVPR